VTSGTSDGRARLSDVAKAAGVHPSTASRALTGARGVSPELLTRVRRAADRLGYRVDPIGRALRGNRTGTLGVVVPDIVNPFFPALVQALEQVLRVDGRSLFLCDAGDDPFLEADRIDALLDRRIDGLIVSPVHHTQSAAAIDAAASTLPVVQVDRWCEGTRADFVGVDQASGMAQIVSHLRAQGRTRLAFIGGDLSISTVAERVEAFQRLPLPGDGVARTVHADLSVDAGVRAVESLASSKEPLPDALVCANDLIALGALKGLRSREIPVPAAVAVTGFDDTPFARISNPELTTVRQPIGQIAEEAIRLLDRTPDTHRGRAAARMILRPELVVRASTGDPR
jgi:LacI family transcriptional regulator